MQEYDASVAYLHNSRPYLSPRDVNLNLPCSSEHWEAESAHSWATLHPWTSFHPSTPRLRPLIKILFDGTDKPMDKVDEKHCLIIIVTLLRVLWALTETKMSVINELVETGPDNLRGSILKAIDRFTQSPTLLSKACTRVEMTQLVQRVQLVHVAHLYGAGGLMNWLYPFLRNGTEAKNAKVCMNQWAVEDPGRVREVAYHSAQILALARQFPNNMPFEAFVIFHAGVVLSFMSGLLSTNRNIPQVQGLRLDHLDSVDDPATSELLVWIRDGGDRVLSLNGVPSLCTTIGRQQVLDRTAELLKRRHVWGIAENFITVVLTLRDEGLDRKNTSTPADCL
jgi:hypothetical protein